MSSQQSTLNRNPIIGITVDIDGEYLRLRHHYSDAIIKAGGIPALIPPSGNPASYAERIDGLLIPGGDDVDPSYYNEGMEYEMMKIVNRDRTDFEISTLNEIVKLRRPVLGICYGMQLINVALGGSLYQDLDSYLPVAINHRKDYHIIVIEDCVGESQLRHYLRLRPLERFSVNSTHHQAIKTLGRGLKAVAFSPDNVIEAICMEDYPFLLGVQWHPERLMDNRLSQEIFRSFVEASIGNR